MSYWRAQREQRAPLLQPWEWACVIAAAPFFVLIFIAGFWFGDALYQALH